MQALPNKQERVGIVPWMYDHSIQCEYDCSLILFHIYQLFSFKYFRGCMSLAKDTFH